MSKQNKNYENDIAELARAVNLQARLLHEMVRACQHIVTVHAELTKVETVNKETAK